jgi:hypothetical protein
MNLRMVEHDPRSADTGRVSPELALVDPDLARRLQRWVPARRPRRPPLPSLRSPRVAVLATDTESATS